MFRSYLTFTLLFICFLTFSQDNKFSTYTTFFRYDETSLNPKTYGKLNRFFESLKKPEIIAVFISCYQDSTLSADANMVMANSRSNSLKGYMTAIGVPGDVIKNRFINKQSAFPSNFTDEMRKLYRVVNISVSYKVRKNFDGFDFTSYKLPKQKTRSYSTRNCSRDTTIEYGNGLLVTISYCDYFNRRLNLEVNEYYNDQFPLFQTQLIKVIDKGMKPLSIHSFNFADKLYRPLEIAIPVSQCLNTSDYSIVSLNYDYNPSQIIEDKQSGYYKFTLKKPGTFVFEQLDYEEQEYDIEFIAKNGIELHEIIVGIKCPRSLYRQKIENDEGNISIKLPYPDAEPKIYAKGVNTDGDTLVMKFKPINNLKSKNKINQLDKESLVDNLNTIKFSLYRKYYLNINDFDLMADTYSLLQ